MRISVEEAKGQLTELVTLAHQGEEVVLVQDGRPAVRLEPIALSAEHDSDAATILAELRRPLVLAPKNAPLSAAEKRKIIDDIRRQARRKNLPSEPDAARSQDFLYDEFGLPK